VSASRAGGRRSGVGRSAAGEICEREICGGQRLRGEGRSNGDLSIKGVGEATAAGGMRRSNGGGVTAQVRARRGSATSRAKPVELGGGQRLSKASDDRRNGGGGASARAVTTDESGRAASVLGCFAI